MTRYSKLWLEQKNRVSILEKELEQQKFQIDLANGFINDGHQKEFADWVAQRFFNPPTDTGSVT